MFLCTAATPTLCIIISLFGLNLPVFGFQGVHGMVIHGVKFLLTKPVEETHGKQLEQDVDESCVVKHVNWRAVIRDLTDDPGSSTGADVHLQERK